ncbi:hypothetical protein [Brevibacterium moorei]|uniref:hypothetical protein n=1 Tax=Brevibacterium moorei TaxID=2968457 RepID=UPI00211D153A|nr:hypothetical protein [Brevibacterium sp. 68QC2CO]MCQ9384916.1 hypothetical protein [Brevibacterium sp. 68QC2CO]
MVLRILLGVTFSLVLLGQVIGPILGGPWGWVQTVLTAVSVIGLVNVVFLWNRIARTGSNAEEHGPA